MVDCIEKDCKSRYRAVDGIKASAVPLIPLSFDLGVLDMHDRGYYVKCQHLFAGSWRAERRSCRSL